MQGFDTLDIIKQIIICLFHPEGWEFRSIKKKGSACFSHYIIVTKRKSSFCKLSRFLTTMEKCNSPIKWVAFSGSLHFFPCLFQFFYNDHIVFLELGKKVFSCLFLSLAGKKKWWSGAGDYGTFTKADLRMCCGERFTAAETWSQPSVLNPRAGNVDNWPTRNMSVTIDASFQKRLAWLS